MLLPAELGYRRIIKPKNGIEPIFKSYKEFVLPFKLFRPLFVN